MARITVILDAGQAPTEFRLGGTRFVVRRVIDRWFGEDHAYFKLLTVDGTTYILRHDLELDEWELTLMDGVVAEREAG